MSPRLKFFLSHMFISLLIAFCIILVVFFIWYPTPLAEAVGVTHIFLMLIAIDVIIGPLLGLFVFKEGKKTLKMDLGIIILVQFIALVYGVYNLAVGRPVWIVQNGDRFELVRNNDIIIDHINQAKEQYQKPSWINPQYVAVNSGDSIEERNKILFEALTTGISSSMRPELYMPLGENKLDIQNKAHDIKELNNFNDKKQVQKVLLKYPEASGWFPLSAINKDMTVLIDKKSGKIIQIVDLRPWK